MYSEVVHRQCMSLPLSHSPTLLSLPHPWIISFFFVPSGEVHPFSQFWSGCYGIQECRTRNTSGLTQSSPTHPIWNNHMPLCRLGLSLLITASKSFMIKLQASPLSHPAASCTLYKVLFSHKTTPSLEHSESKSCFALGKAIHKRTWVRVQLHMMPIPLKMLPGCFLPRLPG